HEGRARAGAANSAKAEAQQQADLHDHRRQAVGAFRKRPALHEFIRPRHENRESDAGGGRSLSPIRHPDHNLHAGDRSDARQFRRAAVQDQSRPRFLLLGRSPRRVHPGGLHSQPPAVCALGARASRPQLPAVSAGNDQCRGKLALVLKIRKRSRLPHWDTDLGPYFVTFNLADAMPHDFRDRLRAEREVRLAELEHLKKAATRAELYAIDQVIRERAEELLDMNTGKCWMRDQRVAEIVANALMHFDEDRYLLLAWCVMPNHVHVALNARDAIDRILHSWKSFSAKEANRLLGRHGEFWQAD